MMHFITNQWWFDKIKQNYTIPYTSLAKYLCNTNPLTSLANALKERGTECWSWRQMPRAKSSSLPLPSCVPWTSSCFFAVQFPHLRMKLTIPASHVACLSQETVYTQPIVQYLHTTNIPEGANHHHLCSGNLQTKEFTLHNHPSHAIISRPFAHFGIALICQHLPKRHYAQE